MQEVMEMLRQGETDNSKMIALIMEHGLSQKEAQKFLNLLKKLVEEE